MRHIIEMAVNYEKLDAELKTITGLDLETLVDIAKYGPMCVCINGKNHDLSDIADAMRKSGLSFNTIYGVLFQRLVGGDEK